MTNCPEHREMEALGFGFSKACCLLDDGIDPRTIEVPMLIDEWFAANPQPDPPSVNNDVTAELAFLRYFYSASEEAFGPASSDIYHLIAENYDGAVPDGYKPE